MRGSQMTKQPNVVVLFPDQLRAQSLALYGNSAYQESQIETPNIDRLASSGVTLNNAISNCPVCTPARAMLVTGRYPQSTGHVINSIRTRHSEISIADAFANQGYKTAWVGKWHLHTGAWPAKDRMPMQPDWVPEGRDRLGFEYWRAYNQHMVYFDGFVNKGDWNYERWDGYETDGLLNYAFEFMDDAKQDPFLLFLSPHPPHYTPEKFAPDEYYEQLPDDITLPQNVPEEMLDRAREMYRHYLAMILAIDDMLGKLVDYLTANDLIDNTILLLTSDHGTQGGSQGVNPWAKKNPYDASVHIPAIVSFPQRIKPNYRTDTLTAMVDFFPTLCGLAGVPVPKSVEGTDLSKLILEEPVSDGDPAAPDSVFLMNFTKYFDWFQDGAEWRGVRTKTHMYCQRLNGLTELYDLRTDPLQVDNIIDSCTPALVTELESLLQAHQKARSDELVPCTQWRNWLDEQRRVVRNATGELSHPESPPDWSLLE